MNLTKLFNFKYFYQNLKKSKGIAIVFALVLPVINFFIFLTRNLNTNNTAIMSMRDLSVINIILMFVGPIVLSFLLFGYMLKKKNVDFIASLPISRKSIFFTNTFMGILMILAINLINAIVLIILNYTNVFATPLALIFDHFLLWSIIYVFIFVTCNLAIISSGNMLTSLIVTCLLLCFVPFSKDLYVIYRDRNNTNIKLKCDYDECKLKDYICYSSDCENDLKNNVYNLNVSSEGKADKTIYPYYFASKIVLGGSATIYDKSAILLTFLTSIVYIVAGYFMFKKRNFEDCETSFKNLVAHGIVKAMVLLPIIAIIIESRYYEDFAIVIIILLLCLYYAIYDFLTLKKISFAKSALFSFLIIVLIEVGACFTLRSLKETTEIIKVSDIKKLYVQGPFGKADYINDRKIINFLISNIQDENSYRKASDKFYRIYFKTNNGTYSISTWLNRKVYKEFLNLISKSDEICASVKDINKDKVFAVSINGYAIKDKEIILDLIDKTVNSKSFSELMSTNSDNDTNIALYYYESHVIKTNNIPTKLSKELEEYVVLEYQKILKAEIEKQIKKKKVDDIYVSISDYRGFNNLKLNDDELDFVTSSSSKEIVYYIKDNLDEKVDLNKPYVSIDCYIGENIFPFYTNNVDKLENLISKLSDKISFDSLEEADVDE